MSGFYQKLEYLSVISDNFISKPNPYVSDDTRQKIRFKSALTFSLLVGSTILMTLKAFKGWRSKPLTGLIAFNFVGSAFVGAWMLKDLNDISKTIPEKQIQQRLNADREKKE